MFRITLAAAIHRIFVLLEGGAPLGVLLVRDGEPCVHVVAGENIARDLTRQGMQTFTPRYTSQEQVLGKAILRTSDIYSLGVVLFMLVTGFHAV